MRLSNGMRESILEAETKLKFDEKISAAHQNILKFLEKEVSKIHKSIKIPQNLIDEGFIHLLNCVRVKIPGHSSAKKYDLSNYFPAKKDEYEFYIPFSEDFEKLYNAKRNLTDERDKFQRELRNVLFSFTTDLQVIEAIPELKLYFKDSEKQKTSAIIPYEKISLIRKELAPRKTK